MSAQSERDIATRRTWDAMEAAPQPSRRLPGAGTSWHPPHLRFARITAAGGVIGVVAAASAGGVVAGAGAGVAVGGGVVEASGGGSAAAVTVTANAAAQARAARVSAETFGETADRAPRAPSSRG